jgi:hypothetical protein
MSRFRLLGQQSPQRYQRRRRHTTAWPALLTEHRARPLASYLKGRSQFQCAAAYTAAVGLVAKSYGAGRIRDSGTSNPRISSFATANFYACIPTSVEQAVCKKCLGRR